MIQADISVARTELVEYVLAIHAQESDGLMDPREMALINDYFKYRWMPSLGGGSFMFIEDDPALEPLAERGIQFQPWAESARVLLDEAQINVRFRSDVALRSYFAAKRYLMIGESEIYPSSIHTNIDVIAKEIEDFPDTWRTSAIKHIIDRNDSHSKSNIDDVFRGDSHEELDIDELMKATKLLQEEYLESFRRLELIRVNILTFMLVTTTILTIFFSLGTATDIIALPPLVDPRIVMAAGAIGASVSGILTMQESIGGMSADQVLGYWLSIARIIVGAVSALLVTVFLYSGFVESNIISEPLVLGVAFAAGFTERLLFKVVGSFEGVIPA